MSRAAPEHPSGVRERTVQASVQGRTYPLAVLSRAGAADPVLYLHGLGSTKADFSAAFRDEELGSRALLALDFPGCGDSPYPDTGPLDIGQLSRVVVAALDALDMPRVAVVGHSMGGLVGLLMAVHHPARVSRFVNVEGNLAAEDCGVFSREALRLAETMVPAEVVRAVRQRLGDSGKLGFDQFTSRFPDAVKPAAFVDYCRSIVQYSDGEPLLSMFLSLPMPRALVHGSANGWLPYLNQLRQEGVAIYEIPDSDHFPAYSNPQAYYTALREALALSDAPS